MAVRPDFGLEVRSDLLEEEDGPTLIHGIQGVQDSRIFLSRHPDPSLDSDRLQLRYQKFTAGREAAS